MIELRTSPFILGILLSLGLIAADPRQARAEDAPEWTQLIPDPDQPLENPTAERHLPESTKSYTLEQIDDGNNPPDWYPSDHPPAPAIVAHGIPPNVPGCALCHLYSGLGHPESANLAGQPAAYLARQMADYKSGARFDPARMTAIGKGVPDGEARAAANWFAGLRPIVWFHVIETSRIPKTRITKDHLRVARTGTATEALGNRIVEVAQNAERTLDRDPRSGFISYAPPGSIARGKALVGTGVEGRSIACTTCHGPDLRGVGDVPRIAGLSAVYVGRQLAGFRGASRTGPNSEPMRAAAARLTNADMLYLAAYLVSLRP
jgi:cytochrome c553